MKVVNMKNITIVAIMFFIASTNITAIADSQRKGVSVARLKAFHERIKHEGGFVTKPTEDKKILFINQQSLAPKKTIKDAVDLIEKHTHLRVALTDDPSAPIRPIGDIGGVVIISADATEPTILVAPENAWGKVNVQPLKVDCPDENTFESRVVKEIWRTFAMVMGAANSPYQPCILRQIKTPRDLDSNPMVTPSPFAYNNIRSTANSLGIGTFVRKTYLNACREGWAPAPTNDIQRAIWEKVHAIPDKPITINFDPNKDK